MKNLPFAALCLSAVLAGAGLHADESAIYLLGGIDGKMLTNQDANNYFDLDGQQLVPEGYPGGVIHLGLQLQRWMSIEASINGGPIRNDDVTYQNGGVTTRHITTRWALTTYSITPGLTWAGPGFVNMLGVRVGQANLAGHVEDDAYGTTGSYDQAAQTTDIGVLFRTSQIVFDHLSIGIELGYDWTQFKDITDKNGTGTYNPPQSPEQNVSNVGHKGDQTTLDFSGGHVALVIGLWSNAPVHGGSSDQSPQGN